MMPSKLDPPVTDSRDAMEKLCFARGVLEILKGTGLFNFLIDRAIDDLNSVISEAESA